MCVNVCGQIRNRLVHVIRPCINLMLCVTGDRCCCEDICGRETWDDLCGTSGHRCWIL